MKTFQNLTTSLLLSAALLFPALANAQDMVEVRETGPFTGISAGSVFKIELRKADNPFVEVTADEEFMEKIETEVRDGVLHIEFKGSARNLKASLVIETPEITFLELSGAASLNSEDAFTTSEKFNAELSGASNATLDVTAPSMEINLSGASNINMAGNTDFLTADTSGASQLKAQKLLAKDANVTTSGAANSRLNVMNHLTAEASGTSRISYDTEPASKQIEVSGVASVNNLQPDVPTAPLAPGDTTRISLGHRDVIIVEDEEKESRRRRKSFRDNWAGFEMGLNGYMAPEYSLNLPAESSPIDIRYERSYVYNLNLFQQNFPIIRNNLGLVTGIGFTWNNYRFDNQTRIIHTNDGVVFEQDTINKIQKNKINLTYINVPLMLEFQTGGSRELEKFHMAAGVIVGARIANNARYVYDDDGERRKEKDYKDFHINPFKFDLTGRIGWGKINLFATYSLNTLFEEGKGPELYPFSVGLRLVSF